jgi:hypothetical protein
MMSTITDYVISLPSPVISYETTATLPKLFYRLPYRTTNNLKADKKANNGG